jgi:hypothetical protein
MKRHCDSSAACFIPRNIQPSIPSQMGTALEVDVDFVDSLDTETGSRAI